MTDFLKENNELIQHFLTKKPQGIYLNQKEWENAVNMLNNLPIPNEKMQELLRYGKEIYKID